MPDIVEVPPPYAQVEDIEARWRPLAQDEAERALTLLSDASYLVDAEYPAIAAMATPPPAVVQVVAEMVRRVLSAPASGYAGDPPSGLTAAPYSQVGTSLYLSKAERRLLESAAGSRSRVRSVRLASSVSSDWYG